MHESLGTALSNYKTVERISSTVLKSERDINRYFIPDNRAHHETVKALWHDENYGLKTEALNYGYWSVLRSADEPVLRKKNLFWKWELKTYFGLSFDQIQEMERNWNTFYEAAEAKIFKKIPSGEQNVTNYAYW